MYSVSYRALNKLNILKKSLLENSINHRVLVSNNINVTTNRLLTTMAKFKVYVTRPDIPKPALDLLNSRFDVEVWSEETPVPRNELIRKINGKDALLCMLTDKIDQEVLNSAGSSLKTVATMSVGYDHLDINELKKRNIRIGYTPDILTDSTAELTIALLLATTRRLIEASEEARNGGWKAWAPTWMCGQSLSNSVVGIVGFGRVGQEVAKIVKAFNASRILFQNRSQKLEEAKQIGASQVTFDELLEQSDFVIVTCALTLETTNLFNDEAFGKMKKNAVFINTSRGGVVDQEALIRALKNEKIAAAGLDVTTPEPLPLDSPLFTFKNCVILPHIGSASMTTRTNMAIMSAQNIICALEGTKMPAEIV